MASIRLFSFFSNTNFTEKTVSFSGNRTRIVALEGKHVDHLSTTTAKLYLMHRRDLKFFLRFGHILTLSSWGCHCSLYLYLWPFFRSVSLQLHSLADFYLNSNIHPSIIFYSLFWVCMTLFSHSLFLSIYKLFHSWPSVCLSMYIYLRGPSVTKRKRSRYRKKYFTLQNTFLLKRSHSEFSKKSSPRKLQLPRWRENKCCCSSSSGGRLAAEHETACAYKHVWMCWTSKG